MSILSFLQKGSTILSNRMEQSQISYEGRLLTENSPFGMMEAYRSMRTAILYSGNSEKSRVIGLVSSVPSEGKSLTCANLAISFAMDGKKVLIIDADIRQAAQNAIFTLDPVNGLTEYLAGLASTPSVQQTSYPSLSVISTGKKAPNPAELLGNGRIKQLINEKRKEFDFIFIDFPPIELLADALLLSDFLDGYIMVVRSGHTREALLKDAVEKIESVRGKILGFALNDTKSKLAGTGFYGYHRKYGKYGKYGSYGGYGGYGGYGNRK
ncbi:MAG: CpsD/CapB family tyrosine-protein kinase [Clostridia bacterium]|nr:CpsD/CapB family tyrosine-protein kinase [Clostridia bacterium]